MSALTIPRSDLTHGHHELYVMEIDTEYSTLQTMGKSTVTYTPATTSTEESLESSTTGGYYCYPEGNTVELWNAEEHYLAVFPDEESLKQGAQHLCDSWGDEMTRGMYRKLQEYIKS